MNKNKLIIIAIVIFIIVIFSLLMVFVVQNEDMRMSQTSPQIFRVS
tara:strand:- start:5441 stop:5578 length:138 start_codon:yes stop_codon:yes gene_type:complete